MRLPQGLPELRGDWLTAYKVLWWLMLAIALVALTLGQRGNPASSGRMELIAGTLDGLIVLAGSIILFWRRPSDPVAALLSFGLLAVPANDVAFLTPNPVFRSAIDNGIDVIPMVCILLGMTVFPSGRFAPRLTLLIFPAILVWALHLLLAGDSATALVQLGVAVPAIAVTIGSLAWRYFRAKPGPARQQVKWVMLGFAAFFACGLLQVALLFIDGRVDDNRIHMAITIALTLMEPAEGACIVGGLLISLLRYRLYDADAAISRSAVYAGLTVVLLAVFAASETLIQALGQQWFSAQAGAAGGAIAAGVAAMLLVPAHHRLTHWAKQRFQRDLSRLRAELPEVLMATRDGNDPNALAEDALRLAMRGVHANGGAILLWRDGHLTLAHHEGIPATGLVEQLTRELPRTANPGVLRGADDALPLRLPLISADGAIAGWLVLGPHPDGSLYGKEDRKALEELAPPLARALLLAIDRSRREAEREAERRRMVDRLAQLEQALAQVTGLSPPPREASSR